MKAMRVVRPVTAMKVMKSRKAMKSFARMDLQNRALCFALRNPPSGEKKVPFNELRDHVRKTDGSKPSIQAVKDAVYDYRKVRNPVGRKAGWQKTSKKDNKTILQTFKQLRPDGCGIDSREIHRALPAALAMKVCRRTVINRLADEGYNAEKKIQKSDPGPALAARRLSFGKEHEGKTEADWKRELQGCGDFKDFTFYPLRLRPKLNRVRASWTYMTKEEKLKPAFVRPKCWFKKSDYKATKKQKVFGFTTSTGKSLSFLVPTPFTTAIWASFIRSKLAPFLRRNFPEKRRFQILLDSEPLLHGPEANAAFAEKGISVLPNWPKYSPELNPQENIWPWAENALRKREQDDDTFEDFGKRCLAAVDDFPAKHKLIASMAHRIAKLIAADGGPIKC